MSNVIPKEKQSAYQRWELASFDEPRRAAPLSAADLAVEMEKVKEQARIAAYNASMEEGRAAGFEQGRAAGFEQGHAAGLEQGRADGLAQGHAQAADERRQLQHIADVFGSEVAQASERIAADVLELALDLSKAMLKTALQVRPELIIPIVGDAIRYLPTLHQPALLFLHPQDVALVKNMMEDELTKAGWRVVEDVHMERGGCRVETASNQIDAAVTTRWQRIAASLGKESDWLAA